MLKKIVTLVLSGLMALSVSVSASPSFWAEAEVNAAVSAGIVPERLQSEYQAAVTREEFCEMAMLLWCKLTRLPMPEAVASFEDTQNASVAAAQSLGIVKGVSATQFLPNAPVTRQEMCVMLKNALCAACPNIVFPETYANTFPDAGTIADWALDAVHGMNLFAVMLGDENGNIQPLGNTTREQSILLAYRLLGTQSMTVQEYIEKFLMPVSGNTHDNMLGGAFAIGVAGGSVYYSDANGIHVMGKEEAVSQKPAKNIAVFGQTIYYIGADDCIYTLNLADGTETKLVETKSDSFAAVNNALYYRNAEDGKIYKMPFDTKKAEVFIDTPAELPVFSGSKVFYTNGKVIYEISNSGKSLPVYRGENSHFCIKNNKMYFLNAEGQLSKADLNGANYEVLSALPLRSFCFTHDCLVALGREDGAAYKIGFDGRYTIKMDTSTYVNINTYDDYVYAQTAEGGIYRFTNNGLEKMKIN